MVCEPPKCAKVKGNCQCPNSWIEYLAKIARERKASQQPRLSLKAHAFNYRRLKKAGKFSRLPRTNEDGVCGQSNTVKLCHWNTTRRLHDRSQEERRFSIVWPEALLKLMDPSIQQFKMEPRVKTVLYDGVPLILKVEDIRGNSELNDFLYTTKVHQLLTLKVPYAVPCLYHAYLLRTKRTRGVHIMERLNGISMENYLSGDPLDFRGLATALRKMLDAFKLCKVHHIDMRPHNIIIDIDGKGRVKTAKAIDFEDCYIKTTVPKENPFVVFTLFEEEDPKSLKINENLRRVTKEYLKLDSSLPRDMAEWEPGEHFEYTDNEDRNKDYSRLPKVPTIT